MARFPFPDQEQRRRAMTRLKRVGTSTLSIMGATAFVSLGLLCVFAAALLISIIQFQIRVIEAKTQSRNFSLRSLTQSVEMQKHVVESVRAIRAQDRILLQDDDFRERLAVLANDFAQLLCRQGADSLGPQCTSGLFSALTMASSPPTVQTFERHTGRSFEELSNLHKKAIEEAIAVIKERVEFTQKHEIVLLQIRSACYVVLNYTVQADRSMFIGDFASGYISAAEQRCLSRVGTGYVAPSPVTIAATDSTQQIADPSPANPGSTRQQPGQPPTAKSALQDDLAGALFFDLIAYYRFYETLFTGIHHSFCGIFGSLLCKQSGGAEAALATDDEVGAMLVEQIVIAPIDISFVLLVIVCGALGAMLRIIAQKYKPELFGPVTSDDAKRMPLYYFVIGVMCSLIVYILAKTVFAGLADTAYIAKSGNMSPFVVAFLAVVSGLLCEEAFQRIVAAGKAALARSTGSDDAKTSGDNPKSA